MILSASKIDGTESYIPIIDNPVPGESYGGEAIYWIVDFKKYPQILNIMRVLVDIVVHFLIHMGKEEVVFNSLNGHALFHADRQDIHNHKQVTPQTTKLRANNHIAFVNTVQKDTQFTLIRGS